MSLAPLLEQVATLRRENAALRAQNAVLQVRIRELTTWWPALWTIVRVEGLEPTNNVADRVRRSAVLWRKGSFGSDSVAGSRFAERLLTVVGSSRQQGRPLLDFLVAAGEAALQGTAAPSLLSTPQRG